ncbi:hypothetical protein LZK73_15395 [Neorhizobium galegae]|nr:hypothetical protein LZK73_15395 [Neorhizobium galegae]
MVEADVGLYAEASAQRLPIDACLLIRFCDCGDDRLKDVFAFELEDGDDVEQSGDGSLFKDQILDESRLGADHLMRPVNQRHEFFAPFDRDRKPVDAKDASILYFAHKKNPCSFLNRGVYGTSTNVEVNRRLRIF